MLRDTREAKALGYCEVVSLGREGLDKLAPRYPESQRMIREAALKLATQLAGALKVVHGQSRVEGRPWYILHPYSRGVACWDATTSLALIYTAAVTPYEVSFLDSVTREGPWTLFTLNRVIDCIFIVDMGLQFVIMQQVDTKKGTDINSFWEYRVSKLARRYLRMWFWIDLFSILPSAADIIPAVQALAPPAAESNATALLGAAGANATSATSIDAVDQIKVLRIIRVLRLAKLVRLFRSSRVIERWETRIAIPYNAVALASLSCTLLYATHCFACVLALTTTFGQKADSWYGAYGYCDLSGFEQPLSEEEQSYYDSSDADGLQAKQDLP